MIAEEAAWLGHPVAHVVAYYERLRASRIGRLYRSHERRQLRNATRRYREILREETGQ